MGRCEVTDVVLQLRGSTAAAAASVSASSSSNSLVLGNSSDDPLHVICIWASDGPASAPVFSILDRDTKAEVLVLRSGFSVCAEDDMSVLLSVNHSEYVLSFRSKDDTSLVMALLRAHTRVSEFDAGRDISSSKEYFNYYARISQQQNMLTDIVRTGTYQRAMLVNSIDFKDKVVVDVGCGTGILSMFAVQAGAKRVYAIEASDMADRAMQVIRHNHLQDKIHVLKGRCEEIDLPEKVDMIISEPMGVMLLNERMLESYVYARKWLKPGGLMFPTVSNMYASLFSDEAYFLETCAKSSFFTYPSFFGIDMRCLYDEAMEEYFNQPAVEHIDPSCLVGDVHRHPINFLEASVEDLQHVTISYKTQVLKTALIHGVASWFDVVFMGSKEHVVLDTGPHSPLTHWYQVRCLLRSPLLVTEGEIVSVHLECKANRIQSFFVDVVVQIEGTSLSSHGRVHLKEPNFRFVGFVPPRSSTANALPQDLSLVKTE